MVSCRRRCGQSAKLQPKFVGPYCVVEVLPNHTYRVERSGQVSVQSKQRLKPYHASPDAVGQAPPLLEPNRQPNHRGGSPNPGRWRLSSRGRQNGNRLPCWNSWSSNRSRSGSNSSSRPQGHHPTRWGTSPLALRVVTEAPPTTIIEEPVAPPGPAPPERSQRARRPPDTWQILL